MQHQYCCNTALFGNAHSERLTLSALALDDQALYCAVMTNPGCMSYVGAQLTPCQAQRSFNAALELTRQQPPTRFYLKVTCRATAQPVGIAAINQLDLTAGTADIGRMLLPAWQGMGLGTELSQLLIRWLHTELNISGFSKHIRVGNQAAIQSAIKLGFVLVGTSTGADGHSVQKYLLSVTAG
uniref:N-acetyltransferase domain-containing protein n=1 Tax=Rheinheimera sp. BAL341 TaxID=1708203 RepID=A0A486XKI7_9GAMM